MEQCLILQFKLMMFSIIIIFKTVFLELIRVFEDQFEMTVLEGIVLKYSIFRICQSPLGFSVGQTNNITELAN